MKPRMIKAEANDTIVSKNAIVQSSYELLNDLSDLIGRKCKERLFSLHSSHVILDFGLLNSCRFRPCLGFVNLDHIYTQVFVSKHPIGFEELNTCKNELDWLTSKTVHFNYFPSVIESLDEVR